MRLDGEESSRRIGVVPVAAGTIVGSDKGSCVLRLRVVLDRWGCGRRMLTGAGERRRIADDLEAVVTQGRRRKP